MALAHIWSSRSLNAFELSDLYEWLDNIPLSKRRTQIEKDFADGLLAAETVDYYFPNLVDMKSYSICQNVQDRIAQWKALNQKVFRKIGLNVPSHTITQLSIAKNGVAQIFLNNLRACLSLSGANPVAFNKVATPTTPLTLTPRQAIVTTPVYPDPMWYKYQLRYNLMNQQPPPIDAIYPNEYEYYWQKKQAERLSRSLDRSKASDKALDRARKLGHGTLIDSNIYGSTNTAKQLASNRLYLPPLQQPYASLPLPIASNNYTTYQTYDPKTKQYINAPAEIQDLKEQLRRMEILLQNKNARIQELLAQLEKQNSNSSYSKKYIYP